MLELKAISPASEIPEDTVHTIGSELSGRPRGVRYTAVYFLLYKVITDEDKLSSRDSKFPHVLMCVWSYASFKYFTS